MIVFKEANSPSNPAPIINIAAESSWKLMFGAIMNDSALTQNPEMSKKEVLNINRPYSFLAKHYGSI